MSRLRPKLTYANVMSTLAVFLVLTGGAAYAASHLGKNSVGTKQLKKNAVTGAKLKKDAVTGVKVKNGSLTGADINLSTLATVPSASHAGQADSIPPAEPTHYIGVPPNPLFESGSANAGSLGVVHYLPAGFYKDHEGIVHLQGYVKVGTEPPIPGALFRLPPGFRPGEGVVLRFDGGENGRVFIIGSNVISEGKNLSGIVSGQDAGAGLDWISFRAES